MVPSQIHVGHQIPLSRCDTDEEEEDEEYEGEEETEGEVAVSSPLMLPVAKGGVSVVEMVAAAPRRSLLLCSTVRAAEEANGAAAEGMQIGRPTDVRHVSHVTFDRFVGFLGLPADLEPKLSEYQDSKSETDVDVDYNCWYSRQDFLEGENGELSWFNAGV